jgi:alanine-synthesizing transaminase
MYNITNDERFVLDLLKEKKILLVHGKGFNWMEPDHFRIVYLPNVEDLKIAVTGIGSFLKGFR